MLAKVIFASLIGSCLAVPVWNSGNETASMNGTQISTKGFLEPSITSSYGGHAQCVLGLVPVTASSMNLKLNISSNLTNAEITQLLLSNSYPNSTVPAEIVGSIPQHQNVTGTFNISAKICFPTSGSFSDPQSIQFLTHGLAFDKSYWDFAPNASYIDNAAQAGQITIAYDRLGNGNSSHPDPVTTVQSTMEISIAHELIQMLRKGDLSEKAFSKIIGVGHSFGSGITFSTARDYPTDFDAVILTGGNTSFIPTTQSVPGLNLLAAATVFPQRFGNLPSGYTVPSTSSGTQYFFFKYPNFASDILDRAFQTIQTVTLGEFFSTVGFAGSAPRFTGAAYVINGDEDLPFCAGNCVYPQDVPAATLSTLFPNAARGSNSSVFPNTGHGINLHLTANDAFDRVQEWISNVVF